MLCQSLSIKQQPPIVLTICWFRQRWRCRYPSRYQSNISHWRVCVLCDYRYHRTKYPWGFCCSPYPLPIIEKQLDAVFSDLNIVAVKVGMLADSDIIELVAAKTRQYQPRFLVVRSWRCSPPAVILY